MNFSLAICVMLSMTCASAQVTSDASQALFEERVVVASSRQDAENQYVKVPLTLQSAQGAEVKKILLVLPERPVQKVVVKAEATTAAGHGGGDVTNLTQPAHYLIRRKQAQFATHADWALAWMGWPSVAELGISGYTHPDLHKDVRAVVARLKQKWPGAQVVLAATNASTQTALTFAAQYPAEVDAWVSFSPHWGNLRNHSMGKLKTLKAMVLYDPSGVCLSTSVVEIEEIAAKANMHLWPVWPDQPSRSGDCSARSSRWLQDDSLQLPTLLNQWLQGLLPPNPESKTHRIQVTRERVMMVDGPSGSLEVSIYTPSGKGPFPVWVFNHGDIVMDSPYIRHQSRFRENFLAQEFLRWGFAVVVPSRPGVGRSAGTYRAQYARNDGDPTYKARQHAQAIIAAINGLQNQVDLDMQRIVLSGQSAGGDAVMYMATAEIPGVQAVVNFSGGRTNNLEGDQAPAFLNSMMVQAWREMGAAARVPVMLIFAENDSRYSANTIRHATDAFQKAGGNATLLLVPPRANDGHYVYHEPVVWRDALALFVRQVGFSNPAWMASSRLMQRDDAQPNSVR